MDISLREWLIIGGVLIVILILVDGWRRVSANRSRLRLEIDRTLSELSEDNPHNPELPNGGGRVRDHARTRGNTARVEPGFAEDRLDRAPTAKQELAAMDPLFDDIPPAVGTGRARTVSQPNEPETRTAPELTVPSYSVPEEPGVVDMEQPIPVLLDEVGAVEGTEVPDDALAAYRQSIDTASEPDVEAESRVLGSPDDARLEQLPETENEPTAPETHELPLSPSAHADVVTPSPRGLKSMPDPEHVLIITVVGRNGQHLPGPSLNRIVTACGMEWGDMSIYHRPEDSRPDAPIQFSMANAVAPGTFDLANLEALETPAVTFFMSLDEPTDAMTAYECMLATAETLAKHLDGDLLDEDRSVMRPQTKEHYRERIRDFEMHQRQRRAN